MTMKKTLKIVIPILVLSLLAFIGYKVVSKINHKKQVAENIKQMPNFSYLTLEQFGLSDDLYIKMNARGKALTDFENFKAILEKKINYEQWEDSTSQNQRKFADKVDTDWTEFLWHYKDEKFLIDDAFMKVVGLHLITQIKGQETNDTLKAHELNDKITKIYNHPNSIMPEDFDKETFNFIVTTLDNYAKANISDLSSCMAIIT